MSELADIVVGVVNSASEVESHPLPVDDPTRRRPDITRAKELLGWEPTVRLREGIEKTAEYFAEVLAQG